MASVCVLHESSGVVHGGGCAEQLDTDAGEAGVCCTADDLFDICTVGECLLSAAVDIIIIIIIIMHGWLLHACIIARMHLVHVTVHAGSDPSCS